MRQQCVVPKKFFSIVINDTYNEIITLQRYETYKKSRLSSLSDNLRTL